MEKYRILSDVFAVPGLFCLFFGALRYLANQGTFHGLNYILRNALRLLTFQQAKPYAPQQREMQDGDCRGGDSPPVGRATRPLLIAGTICTIVASVFAGLYHP